MAGLFEELKRRNVFKVGAAYLVAAWLLLQVSDLLVPVLSLPDWTTRLVFLLLAVGFIPALLLAWAFELTPQGIKRDEPATETGDGKAGATGKSQSAIIAVLLLLVLGMAVNWFIGRDARWAQDIAFPLIEQHTAAAEWEQAYALARQVEAVLPNNETLESMWNSFAWFTSIPSNPPGATVYRRPYTDPDAEWEEMGRTPIYDTHIPFGLSLVRLELEGRPPLLRIIGGEPGATSELPVRESPGTFFQYIAPGAFDFDTNESLPAGMVRVPGQTIGLNGTQTEIRDFHIGRYEVTNQEFKNFVDAGGYQRRDYWEHDLALDGKVIAWQDAMQLFVDKSGRPGPGTWEGGSYADGEGDHPVAGVSWYEAAAYARYAGHELPTVHHWRRAFASGLLTWFLPASNLESGGISPVGEYQGIGWTGTYDMVGNLREWCFNEVDEKRVILGGAWSDAQYYVQQTVTDPGNADPFDRSAINGFRLVSSRDERIVAENLRAPVSAREDDLIGEPVSDEIFSAFLNNFEYDRGPLDPSVEEELVEQDWTRQRITINSGNERMPVYLYLPHSGPSRRQVIVYWPTIDGLILDSIERVNVQLDFALKNGRAVAFPILDGMYERRKPGFPDWGTVAGRDLVIRQVRDMRRTIDYLEERDDIDADAIAYYGFSFGGRLGAIAVVAEPRIKVGIFHMAGLQHLKMPETSVLNYLPRVSVPILQFNGRFDTDFVFETSAKPYFDLIGTPAADKKHVVELTGHFLSRPIVVGETLNWLDKYLGPADPR
jgi:dienelactone hydrolase